LDDKKITISKKKYSGETTVVSARLPVELVKKIDAASNATGRTRTEIVQICLEFSVDNLEIKNNK